MKVLLEAALAGATGESAVYHDWRTLRNSDLLAEAHRQGFTALVTSDKRLASEQSRLPIAVVAVDDNRLGPILAAIDKIAHAIRTTPAGGSRLVAVT